MSQSFFAALSALILLSACGPLKFDTAGPATATPVQTTKAIDGVKYIAKSISRGDDARTYGQHAYTIDADSRVLLRFESLTAAESKIRSDKPILIRIFTADANDQARAVAILRACPIVKDWMMAATWTAGHPFKGGAWTDGAALESEDCVQPAPTGSIAGDCSAAFAVCFDVSAWYKAYAIERGINFGHALISASGEPISILGDASPSKSPRIQWSE